LRQPRATTPASAPVAAQAGTPAPMPTLRSIVVLPPRAEGGHRKRPRRRGRRLPSPCTLDGQAIPTQPPPARHDRAGCQSPAARPPPHGWSGCPKTPPWSGCVSGLLVSTLMVGNELRGGARILGTFGSGLHGRKRRRGDPSPKCLMDDT
jgi:hypothetical protein